MIYTCRMDDDDDDVTMMMNLPSLFLLPRQRNQRGNTYWDGERGNRKRDYKSHFKFKKDQ